MKLKRLLAPEFWRVPKKARKYVVAPIPGPHAKFESIPLLILVRDILQLAEKYKDAKKIIKRGEILVDGKVRKDHRFPVGLFDVITIPKLDKHYRIVSAKKFLSVVEISKKEANLKLCKIKIKKKIKGGKLQLGTHDGRTFVVDKNDYNTHDSLLVQIPENKIKEKLEFKEGMLGLVLKGKNSGRVGKIKEIRPGKFRVPSKVILVIDDVEVEALKRDVFIVGKEKPVITVVG